MDPVCDGGELLFALALRVARVPTHGLESLTLCRPVR